MQYRIDGENLPVVRVALNAGETISCEAGAMSWMDEGIEMVTEGGGLGKMFGRMMTNESAFMNHYTASRGGEIAFAAKMPGSIRAVEVTPERSLVIQKGAYLASFGNINSEVFFQKKVGTGFFGGEGFLMRKYSGQGIVFLEIDGSAHEYDLQPGEKKIIDTGYLAAMSASCSMDVVTVKGIKNVLFGGEGLFNTVVTGPGHVILQSMPITSLAMTLAAHIPSSK